MTALRRFLTVCLLLPLAAATLATAPVRADDAAGAYRYVQPAPDRPDASSCGGWEIEPPAPADGPRLSVALSRKAGVGPSDLVVANAAFPGTVAIGHDVADDRAAWATGATLRCSILFEPGGETATYPPPVVTAQLVAEHRPLGIYGTLPTQPLKLGQWTELSWPLGADSAEWQPLDGLGAWNDTMRQRLRRVGVRFYSDSAVRGTIRIADIAIEPPETAREPLETVDLREPEEGARRGKRFELTFDLSRSYENPFDPNQIQVDAEYEPPSGKRVTLPAFYYQDYMRHRLSDGTETCEPRGTACWKARFTPTVAGAHRYRLTGKDQAGGTFTTAWHAFTVQDAPFRGFVRVDPKDHNYLSFDDGSFFYPIGLIMRCPFDDRVKYHYEFEPQSGQQTYIYDEVFRAMAANGINFTRVWMASWWTALEWSPTRADFDGLGRYSQLSAWWLDHVLDSAETLGIYVDLTLQNHGQFSSGTDAEWVDNPYGHYFGGPLKDPSEFWANADSQALVKRRLRYITGRWASSPAVAEWEMSNEINFTANYDAVKSQVRDWESGTAGILRQMDPYRHLATSHFWSGNCDTEVFRRPEMDVVQTSAYHNDQVLKMLQDMTIFAQVPGKPAMINEFGYGDTSAAHQRSLHAGLWVSSVLPMCGTALYWYWQYVHLGDQYFQYASLARFLAGEDFRGQGFMTAGDLTVTSANNLVEVVGMRSTDQARLWIYDRRLYRFSNEGGATTVVPAADITSATLRLPKMADGAYSVEFWDTWHGDRAEPVRTTATASGGFLSVAVPAFRRDVACKVRLAAAQPPAAPQPSAEALPPAAQPLAAANPPAMEPAR